MEGGAGAGGAGSRAWEDRVVTTTVETKKQASCRAVAHSGSLRQSQAESPASYPMPKPGLARGFQRGYWTERHVLDPHVRAGDPGGRCPEVSGVLQARNFSFVPTPSHAGGICRVRVWSWLRLGTSWPCPLRSSWGSGPPACSPSRPVAGGRDFQAGLRFRIKSGWSGGEGWRGGLAAGLIPAANLLLLPSAVTGLDIPQPPKSVSYPSPSPGGRHSLHFMDEEIETQSPSYLFLIHRKRCRLGMWPVWTLTPSAPVQTAGPQRPRRPPVLREPCSALSAGSLCFSELSLGQDSPLEVGVPAHTPKPLPGREKAGKKAPPRASHFHFGPPFKTSHSCSSFLSSCSSVPWAAGALAPGGKPLSEEVTFQPQLILQGLIHGGPLFQEVRAAAPFLWTPIGLLVHSSNIRRGREGYSCRLPTPCVLSSF
ncbi:uncharacterized protein LOC112477521 isoform X1 [Pteropus alecto]|uniref:uncharacterized protein LOC112477521 isoform X1 n=1 Tax=Pteropus alecto TaxID=9402 RepID=UPI000D536409|nr:uncharacterized protein LOC112477521 isoform X1 [Pteropus alecto]